MKDVNDQLDFDIGDMDNPTELTDQQLVDMFVREQRYSIPKQRSDCNKKVKSEINAKKHRKAQRKARAKQRGSVTPGFALFCMLITFCIAIFLIATANI